MPGIRAGELTNQIGGLIEIEHGRAVGVFAVVGHDALEPPRCVSFLAAEPAADLCVRAVAETNGPGGGS